MSEINLKKDSLISKILVGLLVVLNVLFLVYWVGLSLNYCLHYDDVHFMWKMREYSIYEYVREMYMTRGGNFMAYGLNGIIFSISNWIGDYHFWPIVFYILGIMMTYYSIRGLLKGVENWKVLMGVVALYNVYILTVPDYAVFTWLCAMAYFLYAPAMCLMMRYLNEEKLCWWKWCFLAALALFLSGSNIAITPMVWLLMLVNGLWIWKKNDWNERETWANPVVKRILYVTFAMLVPYVIMFVAPGNFERLEEGTGTEYPTSLLQFGVAWVKCIVMFLYFMAFYLPYHLLAVGLGYAAGSKSNLTIANRWQAMAMVIGAFVVYLAIAVIPLAYLSNGFGIQRNYTHITFFYMLMWFALGYVLGNGNRKQRIGDVLCMMCSVFMVLVMAINLKVDMPLAVQYNHAHQAREKMLLDLQQQGNKEQVVVEKYPSTSTLDSKYVFLNLLGKKTSQQTIFYESDTEEIPNEYEAHIRHLLKLDYDFVLDIQN